MIGRTSVTCGRCKLLEGGAGDWKTSHVTLIQRMSQAWRRWRKDDSKLAQMQASTFLDASSHLYIRVCPSARRSVGRSVGRSDGWSVEWMVRNPFFLNAENEPFSI